MAMADAVLGMLVVIAVVTGMVMMGGLRHEPCRYEAECLRPYPACGPRLAFETSRGPGTC